MNILISFIVTTNFVDLELIKIEAFLPTLAV